MKSKKENSVKVSYESDGKMGKNKKQQTKQNESAEFFNSTQNSE